MEIEVVRNTLEQTLETMDKLCLSYLSVGIEFETVLAVSPNGQLKASIHIL